MFCEQCGAKIPEDSRFCPVCGAVQHGGKVPPNHNGSNMSDEKYKEAGERKVSERGRNMTIASLIFGIISVCFGNTSVLSAVIAICCGIVGVWCSIDAKKNGSDGGLYIAGFVTSVVGIVIGGVGLITLLTGLSMLNSIYQSVS